MSYRRTAPAGLIVQGYKTISLSDSTAVGLDSTTKPATAIRFSVETNSVRFRSDGTDPTLTTGVLLAAGNYFFEGIDGNAVKFQRSTGAATVQLESYYRPGDPSA